MKDNLVRLTETALEKSSRLLSKHHNVKVVFKGNKAITDSDTKTIVLPTVPHDAPYWYSSVLHGHLDKELGYLLFSDIKNVLPQLQDAHSLACVSMVEDLRTSRKYEEIYPGAISDSQSLHAFKYEMIRKAWGQVPAVDRVLASVFMAAKFGPECLNNYGVGTNVQKLVATCLDELNNLDSTQDSFHAGLRIAEILKDLVPPPMPSPQADNPRKQEPQTEEPNKDDKEEEQQEEDSQENEIKESEDPEAELKGQLFQALSGDLDNSLQDEQPPDAFEGDDTTYRIYSTENDSIEDFDYCPIIEDDLNLDDLRNTTRPYVVVMKQKLLNSLRSLTLARRTFNHEVGDLDPDALVSLCLRSSNNVFQQRSVAMKLDVAVAIAIDHSFSMSYGNPSKIWLATQAAITIGDVLSPLKIPFMVYGYSTHNHQKEAPPGDMSQFSRWGSLWIRNYCNFGRPWREGAANLTQAPSNVQTHTYDGESVLYGIRQLLARKEKRKILFVLSDGQPEPGHGNKKRCMSFLRRVVQSGTQAGIEIVGFGIQSAAVQTYFPKHVILRKLDDIVGEPLNILDKALRHNQVLK